MKTDDDGVIFDDSEVKEEDTYDAEDLSEDDSENIEENGFMRGYKEAEEDL